MKKQAWEYIFEWAVKAVLWGGTWLGLALVAGIFGAISAKIGRWVYGIL